MKKILLSLVAMLAASAPASANFPKDTQAWPGYNLIGDLNPGFENGTTQWTASAGTFTTSTSIFMEGLRAAQWTPAASGNTLASPSATLESGISQAGRNGVGSCAVRAQDGATLEVIDGSSNILVSASIPASTTVFQRATGNFVFPNAGGASVKVRVKSLGTNVVYVDSCYLGPAEGFNFGVLSSQQAFAGISAAIGIFSNSSTGAWQNASVAGFATKTYFGTATAPATANDLAFTVPSLPAGTYEVCTNVRTVSEQGQTCYGGITDGTTRFMVTRSDSNNTGASYQDGTAIGCGLINYTTAQTNRTFTIQSQSIGASASRCTISTTNPDSAQQSFISIKSVRPTIEAAYRPDILPASWSGYHQNNCAWSATSTSFVTPAADATCTFTERVNNNFGSVTSNGSAPGTGSYTPSITFTPTRAGRYLACATSSLASGGAAAYGFARLWDGTNPLATTTSYTNNNMPMTLCGVVNATSTAAVTLTVQIATTSGTANIQSISPSNGLDWSITALDQAFPAPVLVGSVTSGSTGAFRIESAKLTSTPSTCTVTSSSSSWIGSGVYNATGDCTYTLTSGLFSAAPVCVSTADIYESRISVLTAASIRIHSALSNGTGTDGTQYLICMGPR